jgi:CHRD domain-containing protein/Big-like domain-containing protein
MSFSRARLFICFLALAGGCAAHDEGVLAPGVETRVTLVASSADPLVSRGETRTVRATVLQGGHSVDSRRISWSSGAPAVATVSADGAVATITAVDDGSAEITASIGAAHASLTVTVRRRVASVTVDAPRMLVAGDSALLVAHARDARGETIGGVADFSYSSSDPDAVLVFASGVAHARFVWDDETSTVIATLVRDGVAIRGGAPILVSPAQPFVFAAALRDERGAGGAGVSGAARLVPRHAAVELTVEWSGLSAPPTTIHLHGLWAGAPLPLIVLTPPPGAGKSGAMQATLTNADVHTPDGMLPLKISDLLQLMSSSFISVDVHTKPGDSEEIRGVIEQILPR